jgi:Rrf2 family protein
VQLLKKETDHAIQIMLYLLEHEKATKKELATELKIRESCIERIIRILSEKQWIDSVTEKTRGFYMAADPKDITMLDIMAAMEDTVKIDRCLEAECRRWHDGVSDAVDEAFQKYQECAEKYLASVTLDNLYVSGDAVQVS